MAIAFGDDDSDARLIAAGPALYAALRRLCVVLRDVPDDPEFPINHALAEAENALKLADEGGSR